MVLSKFVKRPVKEQNPVKGVTINNLDLQGSKLTTFPKTYLISEVFVLHSKTNFQSLQALCLQSCEKQAGKDPEKSLSSSKPRL